MNVGHTDADAESYFRLKEHSNVILAHIALMSIGWAFVLPLAIMLSIARSRFHLPAQLVFLTTNALGMLLGVIYNHQTPDLYKKEKHGPVGSVSTCVASVWFGGSLITVFADSRRKPSLVSEHQGQQQTYQPHYDPDDIEDDVEDIENRSLFAARHITTTILGRILLPVGFLCITTGAVVYSGIFQGGSVFNGVSHFIKGGIFFWYGFLTFGRWTGCFVEFGWAWNMKPPKELVGRWPAMMPSVEFLESAVICLYGASNVWLEHLSNSGREWSSVDLEHVSITVMFFGGGLLGMLIESTTILDLTLTSTKLFRHERIRFPMNPTPAIIIYLLGSTMGEHNQSSMVSTMLHMQWGKLFMGFSLARIATYAILYLRPPMSHLPQRPPTEIITSFCLMAGGLMLMLSNKDTVKALEYNSLDAMFVFNITTGFTTFLMAWAAVCLATKGWAQRKEAGFSD